MQEENRERNALYTEEEIESFVSFSSAFIEQAEIDGTLFEVITQWPAERTVMYQQAFLMFNAATHPEAFGIQVEDI